MRQEDGYHAAGVYRAASRDTMFERSDGAAVRGNTDTKHNAAEGHENGGGEMLFYR